jgi:paraquat-inducible protein B
MSRHANHSLIGAFILGGIAIVVICIALFGAGNFSTRRASFICFFEDSVNGLDTGAPVKFKGVTIGKVSRVLLRTRSQEAGDNAVAVVLEIDGKRLTSRGMAEHLAENASPDALRASGLRARLQQQSILTGLLYVELDLHPGAPARFHKKENSGGYPEIPTLASNLGALMRALTQTLDQLGQIQFAAMGEKADRILASLEAGAAAIDFNAINKNLVELTAAANTLLADPALRQLPTNLNTTLAAAQKLTTHLDERIDPLASEVAQTAAEARRTLAQLNRAADNLRLLAQPGTGVPAQLESTLRQISEAADAVRSLSNYLERRPDTLLKGRTKSAITPGE